MVTAIAALVVLFLLNGVFAMSEMAMMTSRQSRLQLSAKRGSRGAAAALALAKEPTRFLSTVQVCITLIGILAGAYGEKELALPIQHALEKVPALEHWAEAIAIGFVVLGITYFSLVLGELVPKRIALAYPEFVASAIARPLGVLSVIAAVPVRLLTLSTEFIAKLFLVKGDGRDDVSADDVQALMARAASTGVFTPQEHELFKRTVRVGDLRVSDLMVPNSAVVWIDVAATLDAIRVLVGTSRYSHFPVCRGSINDLVGVVHVKDLISYGLLGGPDFKVAEIARKPIFVPESVPALTMLDQFQKTKNHVAFIVNEYGTTVGLITIHDVVAAIVGDVSREGEAPPHKAVRRENGSWLIEGRMPLRDLVETLEITLAPDETLPVATTTAGLLLKLMGRLPTEGEHADWKGWRLEVVDMDGTRIDRVLAAKV
jgi:putative hemolysin